MSWTLIMLRFLWFSLVSVVECQASSMFSVSSAFRSSAPDVGAVGGMMYCMSVVYEICRWLGFVVWLTHVQYVCYFNM
jgi:hypothetical protein